MDVDLVVVGAGLSGLTAARVAHEAGASVQVLEAMDRIGGRIHSVRDAADDFVADLGPSWVWPPYQDAVRRWLETLGVQTIPQFESGDAVVDLPDGVRRGFLPGQHGMRRLVGGPEALVRAMAAGLPEGAIRTRTPVRRIESTTAHLAFVSDDATIRARWGILAVAPRVLVQDIDLGDLLNPALRATLAAAPTWMASMAKVVFTYDRPFWRDAGLSGRIASRVGPLMEVHDMSNDDGRGVLFGFLGVPHDVRTARPDDVEAAMRDQLVRCLGPGAGTPRTQVVQDWAREPTIASRLDLERPPAHPERLADVVRAGLADGRLWLAGAETGEASPGLIDGALEAGERAARACLSAR